RLRELAVRIQRDGELRAIEKSEAVAQLFPGRLVLQRECPRQVLLHLAVGLQFLAAVGIDPFLVYLAEDEELALGLVDVTGQVDNALVLDDVVSFERLLDDKVGAPLLKAGAGARVLERAHQYQRRLLELTHERRTTLVPTEISAPGRLGNAQPGDQH